MVLAIATRQSSFLCLNCKIWIWMICWMIVSTRPYNSKNNSFTVRVISIFNQNWPPRSCDLTQLDFFLGFSNFKVYANKLTTTVLWRRKLNAVSIKFSHIYTNRSWKISTKECIRVSKTMEAIHPICYSIHNLILYISWINKNFTIFNYKLLFSTKITSCMNFNITIK